MDTVFWSLQAQDRNRFLRGAGSSAFGRETSFVMIVNDGNTDPALIHRTLM